MSRVALVTAFLLTSLPIIAHAEEVKLGFVDLRRALTETEDGRKATANQEGVRPEAERAG